MKHLDEHYTEIKIDDIVQPFEVKNIKGEGMPHHNDSSEKGDLLVKLLVDLPKKIND